MARELSSPLAPVIEAYVAARRAQGYEFRNGEIELARLDRLACEIGWETPTLGRELVEAFAAPRPHENPRTTEVRRSAVRGLGRWLALRGEDAYVLPAAQGGAKSPFVPVVMTEDEVRRLLAAADSMAETPRSPSRHLVVPALLRTLYACGLRIGEALALTVGDVDLARGLIVVRPEVAKFNKGRLVPFSDALLARLAEYDAAMGVRGRPAPFFPSPKGTYCPSTVGNLFRALLAVAGIPRTDDGPTVHSLRHSFACHRIMRWAREGEDVNALLPLLASYLGHSGVGGTERYLRLTAEMMPDLRDLVERRLSWVVPGVG